MLIHQQSWQCSWMLFGQRVMARSETIPNFLVVLSSGLPMPGPNLQPKGIKSELCGFRVTAIDPERWLTIIPKNFGASKLRHYILRVMGQIGLPCPTGRASCRPRIRLVNNYRSCYYHYHQSRFHWILWAAERARLSSPIQSGSGTGSNCREGTSSASKTQPSPDGRCRSSSGQLHAHRRADSLPK